MAIFKNLKSAYDTRKVTKKGDKAEKLAKKLRANRKSREKAEAERKAKNKIHSKAMGKPVRLPKTSGEELLQIKRVKIKKKARKLLGTKKK